MNPWFAKALILIASLGVVMIRAPHGKRSQTQKIVENRKGPLEFFLLTIAWIAFLLPLFWIATPWLSFADFTLRPVPLVIGALVLAVSLWLFHRSHVDLGANWSISLQVRESHCLVTDGSYRYVRHPMYSALLLYGIGQALVLPNWLVGPSYAIAMALLVGLRLGPEEKLMRDRFDHEYETYASRSKRLIPGIW